MGKNLDRASHVLIHELKFPSDIFREFADVQVPVHEQDADHRRRKEVGQVVCHGHQLVHLLLELGVDCV